MIDVVFDASVVAGVPAAEELVTAQAEPPTDLGVKLGTGFVIVEPAH